MNKKSVLLIISGFVLINQMAASLEMPRSLREAERLYQNGKYSEASDKALEFQKLYPNNLQALIILGMSDFYLNDYKSSKKWFKSAQKQSPKHPIILRYLELLRELEYRSGNFSIEPSEADMNDPQVTADFYKRGYFGHAYPIESQQDTPGASAKLMDPILIKEPLPTSTMRQPSDLALPTPHPSVESLFSSEDYMEQMAKEALETGKLEKAYLFYSQLAAAYPKNRSYLIKKAESAFKMKRYSQVLDLLLPISSKAQMSSLSNENQKLVKQLIENSANKKYIPGK